MKSWFENKARRSFWSVHVDALRRSGVSRTEYCRRHRLNKSTFDRWLRVLNSLESVREEARRRRKRTREPVSGDRRNKVVQAFWAMHVEALNWSGLTSQRIRRGTPHLGLQPAHVACSIRCGSTAGRLAGPSSSECPSDRKH